MISYLNSISFNHIIWAVPVILLFHELNEWNIKEWHAKHFSKIQDESKLSLRLWMLLFSLMGFVWTGIACLIGMSNKTVSALWFLVLIYVTLLNGIQHFILLIYYKEINNPGSFFAVWFGIPVDIYAMYRMILENMIPSGGIILFIAVVLLVLTKTFKFMKSGEMPKIIYVCSSIGIKLEHLMTD